MAQQLDHQTVYESCRIFNAADMPETARFLAYLSQPDGQALAAIRPELGEEAYDAFDEVFWTVERVTGTRLVPFYIGSPGDSISTAKWFELVSKSVGGLSNETKARFDKLMGALHQSIVRTERLTKAAGGVGMSLNN